MFTAMYIVIFATAIVATQAFHHVMSAKAHLTSVLEGAATIDIQVAHGGALYDAATENETLLESEMPWLSSESKPIRKTSKSRKPRNRKDTRRASASIHTALELRCFDMDRPMPSVDETVLGDFPNLPSQLTNFKRLGGSNGAKRGEYNGKQFIVKSAQDYARAASEFAAIKLWGMYFKFSRMGRVPTCCLYPDGALLCRWVSDLQRLDGAAILRLRHRASIMSVLSGHYDSGTVGNTMMVGTELILLDLGDCFAYSASGSDKKDHFCSHKSKNWTCPYGPSQDRKCFVATWGTVPFQLFDFRSDMRRGGWENLPKFFGGLTGKHIHRQFQHVYDFLSAAVKTCCEHPVESSIRSTLTWRLLNLKAFFDTLPKLPGYQRNGRRNFLDQPLHSKSTNYPAACEAMHLSTKEAQRK
jgi:hypothetical protein